MASNPRPSSKSRGAKVKPILRKLTQSERGSLDLDRPAAEQGRGLGIYGSGSGGECGNGGGFGVGVGPAAGATRHSHHHRSTSGASQFSTTTTASGHRAGSFVHPFQQTPRPYTPPLRTAASYQHSLRESDLNYEHSPALTEDEDQLRSASQTNIHHPHAQPHPTSNHNLHHFRSPSNFSTRTSSASISLSSSSPAIHQQHPLRATTTKQASFSRLALVTSHTSLHLNSTLSSDITSPSDTMSPAYALRSSLDGFRIRSRSDAAHLPARSQTIYEARRKFLEKEHAEDEKAAREEVRRLEKRNQKEAQKIDRGHRRSCASDRTRSKRSKSDLTMQEKREVFVGREYSSAAQQPTPSLMPGEESYQQRRSGTAKLKTHSAWTKFVMWIRTRFIRSSKD
ncbi:hypothetical protein LZ554_008164 [Drepanopeziza brunnea f. sp. 'monogermtubi']|nr:hypothetical protein LZ554_008164 [Drepanopeziza brunnea f. sp. 'monogermtubi']